MTNGETKSTLYLVDGSNYLFRAFYAIRDLSNSKGFPTNALYGFTNMLLKLIRENDVNYIAVAFDVKGPTFRHKAYDGYKATRRAVPESLLPQIPFVKEIVRGFSIPVLEQEGIEADDILGTLARRYASPGMNVVLVSGDKDLMQLVTDNVTLVDTMNDKTYDRKAVRERFGVEPEQVPEILGLMGDASDNIPGVPGIGQKGAQRLIEEFGSVEGVLGNLQKVHNARAKAALVEHADQARLSRDLAVIRTDADVPFDLEAARWTGPNAGILKDLFREFEFSSLLQQLKFQEQSVEGEYRLVWTEEEMKALVDRLSRANSFTVGALVDGDDPMKADLVGVTISAAPGDVRYLPLSSDGGTEKVLAILAPLLADGKKAKNGHDLKETMILLANRGVRMTGLGCDTMIASYLLNPARPSADLPEVVTEHLGRHVPAAREVVGSGAKAVPFRYLPEDARLSYACRRTDGVASLVPVLLEKIREGGLGDLFHQVEMPLVEVLAAIERKGVLVDVELLKEISREMGGLLATSEERIHSLAGERFNINSPKQLQQILFEKLKLPRGRKTKEGYSTDVDVLTYLAAQHELPAMILSHRSLAKLKSTYVDALPLLVNPKTGRIHTSFNQTVTATGRLSSSNPNLQNIPIRTPEGRRIRQAFKAPEGMEIVSADYSQIELRVMAHLSGDPALVEAFASEEDIHTRTASDVFGVFPGMVTPDMRRQAKVINFGVLYGMSAFGLAKELGITQKQAQAYIDGYFQRYRGVRTFLDGILEEARRQGYVTTLLNRRRYLPEINSSNVAVRQFAERTAINTPIQGSAADLIKVAMVNIHRLLEGKKLRSAMILQVHDELVLEVPSEEKEEVMALMKQEMEEVISLQVPLKVDIGSGRNWDEAHT
jgi:DNA polymerase-1